MTSATADPAPSAGMPWLGYLLAAGGAVLFASKGVLIKLAYAETTDAITILTLRMLLSAPIFVAVGLLTAHRRGATGRAAPADLAKATAVGMLGYWFASYADFKGLETLSPQFERLILFTYPLFVVLFGALLFGQPIRGRSLAAFGFSYLGLAVIFLSDYRTEGSAIAIGALWVLGSAIAFALYQLMAKPLIARIGAPLFTSVAMTGAAAAVVVQYSLTRPLAGLAVSEAVFWIAAAIAILATVLPTYMMNAALSRISAQANSTIGTVSPVITLVLAVAILDEPVGPADLAGTALVIGGIALFTLAERRR